MNDEWINKINSKFWYRNIFTELYSNSSQPYICSINKTQKKWSKRFLCFLFFLFLVWAFFFLRPYSSFKVWFLCFLCLPFLFDFFLLRHRRPRAQHNVIPNIVSSSLEQTSPARRTGTDGPSLLPDRALPLVRAVVAAGMRRARDHALPSHQRDRHAVQLEVTKTALQTWPRPAL